MQAASHGALFIEGEGPLDMGYDMVGEWDVDCDMLLHSFPLHPPILKFSTNLKTFSLTLKLSLTPTITVHSKL